MRRCQQALEQMFGKRGTYIKLGINSELRCSSPPVTVTHIWKSKSVTCKLIKLITRPTVSLYLQRLIIECPAVEVQKQYTQWTSGAEPETDHRSNQLVGRRLYDWQSSENSSEKSSEDDSVGGCAVLGTAARRLV